MTVAGIAVLLTLTSILWLGACAHVNQDRHVRYVRSAFPQGNTLEFSKHPSSKDPILEGRSLTMQCETNMPATVYWTFNGDAISNSSRRFVTTSGWSTSTLTITRLIRTADSGKFTCVATSSSGQTVSSKEALVDVTFLNNPVVELEYPDDIDAINDGIDVQLTCEADIGSGEVQYHWFRNSERVTSKMEKIDVKKKIIHIEQASAKDNGVYRCSVHLDGEVKDSKTNFVLNIKDPSLPHINLKPEDLLLAPKTTAHFDCRYENADIVEWFKNDLNSPIETNDRITIHKNGSISIKNITKRDEGYYSCVAFRNNEKSQLQRFTAKLKIAYIKPLTIGDFEPRIPENRVVVAQEGQPFSLTCLGSKENVPQNLITWKNTEKHLVSDSGEVRVDDGTLIFDTTKREYQGVYTCTSENIAGSQEITIFIAVNPIPTISKSPSNISINEYKPAVFKCEVNVEQHKNLYGDIKAFWNKIITLSYLKTINGKPHHSKKHAGEREFPLNLGNLTTLGDYDVQDKTDNNGITPLTKDQLIDKWLNEFNWDMYELKWKKDGGKTVKEDQDHIAINPREGLLTIKPTWINDKGVYWCEIITSAGMSIKSQPAILSIIEQIKFSPPPVNKRLELNTSAKIHCKVQGTPTPNVVWYKLYNVSLPDDIQSINGTLQFTKVTKAHKGNYSCIASNTQGTIEATIYIDVVVSPRLLSPLPSQIMDVTEGDSVSIDCIAEGDPEPKTQWDRNRTIITTVNKDSSSTNSDAINRGNGINGNERIQLLDNGTLYIKSAKMEDGDRYGCTAGNLAGLRREEVLLIVHLNENQGNEDGIATILYVISAVVAYMLLVIGLMIWCRVRRRRKLARNMVNDKLENGEVELKEKDGPNDKLIENNDDIQNADKYCQMKNAKNKCNGSNNAKAKNGSIGGKNRGSSDNCGNTTGGESGHNRSDNSEMSINSKASKKSVIGGNSAYDKIAMTRSSLYDIVQIGRGEFGDVMIAKYRNPKLNENPAMEEMELLNGDTTALTDAEEVGHFADDKDTEKDVKFVMVKSLIHTKDENHLSEFKRELDMFIKIKHDNVVKIVGLCNEIEPHYLVLEYTDWGDLKQFLLATRTEEEIKKHNETESTPPIIKKTGNTIPLLIPQMLALAHQISKGMECIADNRFVHKDLATRNCIITSKLSAKITLPALTKDTYSKEYCKHVNQVIPLRWLPYECVYDSDYSAKSDVYMFACTIWEIFHKGELPFIKMSDSTVMMNLKNNTLVWRTHDDMPQSLIDLLIKCWDLSPKNRPTFTETTKAISKILKESSAQNSAI